ncbi:cytochrome P450 [Roridomyces roridus]|uniref:Cytochrome P450 n=1 Tax=Roridomyces roridus TaxID=1738132 RepID=A0AAD7FIA2_9AGAR|nr:cytochrome P450 [Roridomyces roridus]
MLSQLLLPLAGTLGCYALYQAASFLYGELTSPLRHLSGPRNASLVLGNFKEMMEDIDLPNRWRAQFGRTFRFKSIFSCDLSEVSVDAGLYAAQCILYVEGDDYKRQRRIMNQAFGPAQIRLLTEIFVEKSVKLRDIWARKVADSNGRIDVAEWLRRMTLDVIGQAGFNYDFDAMNDSENGKPNELNQVLTELLHSPQTRNYLGFLLAQSILPVLRLFPVPGETILKRARATTESISAQIVSASKVALLQDKSAASGQRDLLSVLLQSNLAAEIPENQRMSEEEVITQIPRMFLAGHETTSAAVTWTLYALSLHPAVQTQLRTELLGLQTDNPTMEELNSLAYLEQVVRESMRVYSPIVFTTRVAVADDVLPLATPYVDQRGERHDSIRIQKGQMFYLPILAVHTDTEIWGEDAGEFKPERWDNLPEAVSALPGIWANLLTFFAGPHNCIGYRFSLIEMKAILFTLVRAFEFELGVPKEDIVPVVSGLIQQPTVRARGTGDNGKSTASEGSALPLILRPYGA